MKGEPKRVVVSRLKLMGLMVGLALSGSAVAADGGASEASRQARVAKVMQGLENDGPQLRAFLQAMPKGGDLHNHLGGSNYAEDFLRWADADNACISVADHTLAPPPCGDGQVSARGLAARDPAFYEATVDALSMRNFVPGKTAASGHDQFFNTFARFSGLGDHRAEAVAATLEQAARDRVPYVELIANPPQVGAVGKLAQQMQWQADDFAADWTRLQAQLPAQVSAGLADANALDAKVKRVMHCGQPDASAGCGVRYRYVLYVLRVLPQPNVFGQMAISYALVHADPQRFAAVNIVAPEDNPVALADYQLHMDMFRFLSTRYPEVPLTLHAGELAMGLVPPADMRFHIRTAVDAGAKRIGHGVDIAYEDDSAELLARMKAEHIAVEINLSSNDGILGIKGVDHPLRMYLAAGVPVVLSTDDEGVSRNDMTHEYQRAVQEHGVDYPTLKQIARNGLTYAFIPGQSLWQADGISPNAVCAASLQANVVQPDARCRELLDHSEKARMQWQLEGDFVAFENRVLKASH